MLTPDYLLHISEGAEDIAQVLHQDIVDRIVERITARANRHDNYMFTSLDRWQLQALTDSGLMMDDIIADIAKATNKQSDEIRQAMEDAGIKTVRYDDKIFRAAGLEPNDLSPGVLRIMERNYAATMGEWNNFTRTIADASQQTFIKAMDRAYLLTSSGAVGYTQAFMEAINMAVRDGVTVYYPSGHRDTLETAALRCVRTGISQMSAQVTEKRMDEMGVDLVLVSSHMGARPSHAVWQGKVFSRSGHDRKYPEFRSSTGYGTVTGLCGANCRHNFSPYYEGMENPYDHYDSEENKKLYDETQQQRALERRIRRTKREMEGYKTAQDSAEGELADEAKAQYERKAALLKKQTAEYNQFCDDHDLRPLRDRLAIAKVGRETFVTVPDVKIEPKKPALPPETFEQKVTKIRERVKTAGRATEEDIKEAGRLVRDEVKTATAERDKSKAAIMEERDQLRERRADIEERLQAQIDAYEKQIDDIMIEKGLDPTDPFSRLMLDDPRVDEIYGKIAQLKKESGLQEINERMVKLGGQLRVKLSDRAKTLKDVLGRFREMGHPNARAGVATKRGVAKILADALDYYPKDWIQYAIDSGGITCRKVNRGYCSTWRNEIMLSGWDDDDLFETAFHELGHYFDGKASISDTYVPRARHPEGGTFILDAERAFYKRRTAGEELEWLGAGYDRTEVTRKDKFIHKYMGKDYGGEGFELCSMGFQYAYTDPERLATDPDMEEWIYGILALY